MILSNEIVARASLATSRINNDQKHFNRTKQANSFPVINPHLASTAVSSAKHWAIVLEDRDEQPVRTFTCITTDHNATAESLKKCGNHTVAMNQLVVWITLHQILKR